MTALPDDIGLIIRKEGRAGRITLNRPRALNALTFAMTQKLHRTLVNWIEDPDVLLVVVDAAGGRAFCAGGDIGEVYESIKSGDLEGGRAHCRAEYRLNALIARYPKPYVALIDGVVMGGGIGLSCHGSQPVVTERTALSLPECSIGFIPDAGATDLLARAPGRLGEYLGLTGTVLKGADCIHAGFARHFVTSERLPAVMEALVQSGDPAVLQRFGKLLPAFTLEPILPWITAVFSQPDLPAIVAALENTADEESATWRQTTLKQVLRCSPLALAVTLSAIRALRPACGIEAALRSEYRIVARCMVEGDLMEGVRANIVDRDRQPKWRFTSADAVDPALVAGFLAPLGDDDLTFAM
jgi:enoyl-CoA hydratase